MRSRLFPIPLAVLALACGDASRDVRFRLERAVVPVAVPDDYIEPRTRPHIEAFFADAVAADRWFQRPDRLRVLFVEGFDVESTVGTCVKRQIRRAFSGTNLEIRTVHVLSDLGDVSLRRTIYHELGHCLLGLGHEDARSESSIMSSHLQAGTPLDDDWREMVDELFATWPSG